ncbi:hypothetical protein LguiB_019306 [Lonicera macranthoides]
MRKDVAAVAAVTTAAALAAAVALIRYWKERSERRWRQTQKILRKLARDCATPVRKLWHVTNDLVSDMEAALSSSSSDWSILPMLPAYLSSLPTGDETGLFYGVNLRGDSFLILCAHLGGKNEPISELQREEVFVPSNLIDSTSKELFDFIVLHLAKFSSIHNESIHNSEPTPGKKLGFTVSFPAEETATTSGTAIKRKCFAANDKIGQELVNDMNEALEKHGLGMRVLALVEHTIGGLAGGRYYSRDCVAGVSLGMSTNAAYVESAQSVPKWNVESPKSGEMVIDTQWGSFKSSHLPITEFDTCLDIESSNPENRIFEKLISGMYLGEIVRKVLLKMAQETALFGNSVPTKLSTPYLLRPQDVALMHQDTSEDRDVVNEKLNEVFGITDSTPMVREVVAEVCDVIVERGARLAGAGIVAIVKKLGRIANKKSVVTVEGGLYEHYRIFRNYLNSSVWEMLGSELSDNVIIEHSHGGSGAGALFLAASQTQNSDS